MLTQDIHQLRSACEDFGVPLTKPIAEADACVSATEAQLAKARAEAAPDPYSLTLKNVTTLHAEMVAWPAHDERVRAAETLARVAAGQRTDAWQSFAGSLLEAFRAPFDDAVSRYLSGDTGALHAVQQLGAVRDTLAHTTRRAKVRSDVMEEHTRVLTVPDCETAINRVRPRTQQLGRLSAQWISEVIALGCTIRWQTPDQQEAADKITPAKIDAAALAVGAR